jgi:hypothetical protein
MLMNQTSSLRLKDLTKVGGFISRKQSQEMIETWQQQEPDAIRSFLYGRKVFEQLLSVPGCAGIRVFNGINAENRQALVFAAMNEKGDNILEYYINTNAGLEKVIAPLADQGVPCPEFCSKPKPRPNEEFEEAEYLDMKARRFPENLSISEVGAIISLKQAQEMIETWQQQEPDAVRSIMYGRHIFDELLSVPGCEGIKVFNAINATNMQAFVFVAADNNGGNILEYYKQTPDGRVKVAAPHADSGLPCPEYCSKPKKPGDPGITEWEDEVDYTDL